ncbi:hypothetical protein ACI8AF_21955 [Blastococcus sp. SYSU D00669]
MSDSATVEESATDLGGIGGDHRRRVRRDGARRRHAGAVRDQHDAPQI